MQPDLKSIHQLWKSMVGKVVLVDGLPVRIVGGAPRNKNDDYLAQKNGQPVVLTLHSLSNDGTVAHPIGIAYPYDVDYCHRAELASEEDVTHVYVAPGLIMPVATK